MKRYFHIPNQELVCELTVKKGSNAETANIDVFRKYLKADDAVEVTKKEYRELCIKYGC